MRTVGGTGPLRGTMRAGVVLQRRFESSGVLAEGPAAGPVVEVRLEGRAQRECLRPVDARVVLVLRPRDDPRAVAAWGEG